MITTLNGTDTITTISASVYRAHRAATWWIGDFATYADAQRALQIANSAGATREQRGIYDGGAGAGNQRHDDILAAYFANDLFGIQQPVSAEDVRRTILPGERYTAIGGLIPAPISNTGD